MFQKLCMVSLVGFAVVVACQKKVNTTVVETVTEVKPAIQDPTLQGIMATTDAQVPDNLRRDWPFVSWSYAKAYTYNFSDEMRNIPRYAWSDSGWAETITNTIDLNSEQATVAMELIHRAGGGLIMTKCPIVPRHAVVFFNQKDEPVGSMNICFSCEDTAIWPRYYETSEEAYSRFDLRAEETTADDDTGARFLLDSIHSESIANWQTFFDLIGAERYQ